MHLIDEVTFHLEAGKGGDGKVHFRHEKYIEHGGPSGGAGGNGGSVWVEGVSDISYLQHYRHKTKFAAPDGQAGGNMLCAGKAGEDLVMKVPVGSVIINNSTGWQAEVLRTGEKILLLKGGKGGYGNYHFRSAVNRTPMEFEKGTSGEIADIQVELRLIVDVGLIGLPNAGKSSLLNELTAAKAKVASYPFTTLEPNLGMMGRIILADIPGLIEGASRGKGLGEKFLRHISRAKILLHCISLEEVDILKDYKTIRKEMGAYDKALLEKPEIVVLTKHDLVNDKTAAAVLQKTREKLKPYALTVSIHDLESIQKLAKALEIEVKNLT